MLAFARGDWHACDRLEQQITAAVWSGLRGADLPMMTGNGTLTRTGPPRYRYRHLRLGDYPVRDPIFRVPVWLQASCCGGNLLWAYNLAHLAFLESFVAATIRERSDAVRASSGYRRMSMIAKLPAWLKTAKTPRRDPAHH